MPTLDDFKSGRIDKRGSAKNSSFEYLEREIEPRVNMVRFTLTRKIEDCGLVISRSGSFKLEPFQKFLNTIYLPVLKENDLIVFQVLIHDGSWWVEERSYFWYLSFLLTPMHGI